MESFSTSLIVIVVLLVANGFFVAAEFALVKIRTLRVENLAKEGGLSARLTLKIKQNLEPYLAACQLGITMASLGLGWVGEPAVAKVLEPLFHSMGMPEEILHFTAFMIGFIIFSSLHIVIGEQVPKTYAIRKPEPVSIWVAIPLHAFFLISYPLTKALNWASSAILRSIGVKEASHEEIFSDEELSELIDVSSTHGNLDNTKAGMIQNMFVFDSRIVRDIMVSRSQIDWIDVNSDNEAIKKQIIEQGHSRFPLVRDNLDNIVGVLLVKDLLHTNLDVHVESGFEIESLARKSLIVPEVMGLQKAFDQMRNERSHMALVVDEYGALSGIITMEDLIEEIVGEISDELDEEAISKKIKFTEGFEVAGLIALHDFEKQTSTKLDVEYDVSTLSGLIMSVLNEIPKVGDKIEYADWEFTVKSLEGNRAEKILAILKYPDDVHLSNEMHEEERVDVK
ncbi:hemolysin family protein [Thiomicrorhabdus lithotrophica]|uniref:Hemolysin family protein n=1 Tax=Thiomicrorhabdus lithotrophica TaxID=2949997 RepID=A0ABY8C991_9GAMM|nr:hemolysin family protein [Thiomicrorhabdus lithotrophica]WEJ62530.1 hemolysin family protein [Thiomicrorhabdus lithotrophica]